MAARKDALEDVNAASLVFHAQEFASATEKNVVPNFTKESVQHCISYANTMVPSEQNFPVYVQRIQAHYAKIRVRENLYVCIFYPV